MVLDLLLVGLGLVILLLAGDALVRGAVNLSLRLGIPALIVSLTIVAFGTSAPELLIAVQAALENAPGIAMGNVVGSNTANILLVLGVPAIISGLKTDECDTKRNYLFMIGASLLFFALCFVGQFTWQTGLILLAALAFVLWDAVHSARRHRAAGDASASDEDEEPEGADPSMPWWKIIGFLALGLIGLPLGADLLVESSIDIARVIGVSEAVIGLTLVAVGTSLPELATTVMAAMRRQADVALGNVIGSNMFNLLAIIGIASFVAPIPVPSEMLRFDLWVMLAASLALVPFVFLRWNMTKVWGFALTGLYVAYVLAVLF
ncbi:calcium/sodium antiporter [Actibacterium pelagium]|uniref:Sodium:calcium antiporter n=1 Tax=Actibacterium pelagium TaxID=2029103 RepID=A0A917AKB9_9RHOB|nr:calcium/sodium antiporter [Actibacterium pelagium]GGE58762.1 sodium:calcium antiporter [Actibacterium pelagium]